MQSVASVTKAKKTATVVKAKPAAATKAVPKAKPDLFSFTATPTGPLLRAYFIALALRQLGGNFVKSRKFKLWPRANFSGHVHAGRLNAHGKDVYSFTAEGVTYFRDTRPASKNLLDAMLKAVGTGKPPVNHYNVPMQALQ